MIIRLKWPFPELYPKRMRHEPFRYPSFGIWYHTRWEIDSAVGETLRAVHIPSLSLLYHTNCVLGRREAASPAASTWSNERLKSNLTGHPQ
eukprot:scaffold614_cov163-Amphora_coffeaeformis.AAC.6